MRDLLNQFSLCVSDRLLEFSVTLSVRDLSVESVLSVSDRLLEFSVTLSE